MNRRMAIALALSLGFLMGADKPAHVPVAKSDNYLVVFYANWCPPCKKMKSNVWPNREIQALVKQYKNKKIYWVNVDKEKAYVRKYKVYALPTVMVISSEGKALKRATGYMTIGQVKEFLSKKLVDTGKEEVVVSGGAVSYIRWAIIEFAKFLLFLLG